MSPEYDSIMDDLCGNDPTTTLSEIKVYSGEF
jgi:hypothetical protein